MYTWATKVNKHYSSCSIKTHHCANLFCCISLEVLMLHANYLYLHYFPFQNDFLKCLCMFLISVNVSHKSWCTTLKLSCSIRTPHHYANLSVPTYQTKENQIQVLQRLMHPCCSANSKTTLKQHCFMQQFQYSVGYWFTEKKTSTFDRINK